MKTMLAALCLLMLAPKSSFAQSGSLDPNFGFGGLLISDQVLNYDLQIQADHKLIIGGSILTNNDQKSDMMVERLLENGVVDSTFGLNGKAIINFDDLSTTASLSKRHSNVGPVNSNIHWLPQAIHLSFRIHFSFPILRLIQIAGL